MEKTSFKKFSHKEWLYIEQKLPRFDEEVCKCMINLGKNIDWNKTISEEKVLNEEIYQEIIQKQLFGSSSKIINNKKDINKKKKINKFALAKEKLEKEKILLELNDIIESSKISKLKLIKSKIFDLKLASIIIRGKELIKNKNQYTNYDFYELISFIKRLNPHLINFKGYDYQNSEKLISLSFSIKNDLEIIEKNLIKISKFSIETLLIDFPHLLNSSSYDINFQQLKIKPYESQIEILNLIRKPVSSLIFYKTIMGSGKTSLSIALAAMASLSREEDKFKMQVIFCCGIESVRQYVGRLAYNSELSFALAVSIEIINDDKNYKIINSWKNKNDKSPLLIIADLETTYRFLKFNYEKYHRRIYKEKYVLFLDEPLINAKNENSKYIESLIKIMEFAPNKTILSSATLPIIEKMPCLKEIYVKNIWNFREIEFHTVQATEFITGCDVYSFKREVFFPHINCKNLLEFNIALENILNNKFLMRLYSTNCLVNIVNKMKNLKGENIFDIENIKKLNFQNVNSICFDILKNFEKYFNNESKDIIDQKVKEFCSEDNSNNGGREKESYINCNKLATVDSWKFIGGCLIITENPLNFCENNFGNYCEKYCEMKKWKKENSLKEEIISKLIKTADKIKDEEKKARKLNEIQIENSLQIKFEDSRQINTKEHLLKYNNNNNSGRINICQQNYRNPIFIRDIIIDEIDDLLLEYLSIGVIIYMENCKFVNKRYLDLARKYIARKEFAYIISDESCFYGVNFPINNIILFNFNNQNITKSELFQIMGRAGRIGLSESASIYLDSDLYSNITKIREDNFIDIETINIEKLALRKLLSKKEEEEHKINYNEDFIEEKYNLLVKLPKISIVVMPTRIKSIIVAYFCIAHYIEFYTRKFPQIDKKLLFDKKITIVQEFSSRRKKFENVKKKIQGERFKNADKIIFTENFSGKQSNLDKVLVNIYKMDDEETIELEEEEKMDFYKKEEEEEEDIISDVSSSSSSSLSSLSSFDSLIENKMTDEIYQKKFNYNNIENKEEESDSESVKSLEHNIYGNKEKEVIIFTNKYSYNLENKKSIFINDKNVRFIFNSKTDTVETAFNFMNKPNNIDEFYDNNSKMLDKFIKVFKEQFFNRNTEENFIKLVNYYNNYFKFDRNEKIMTFYYWQKLPEIFHNDKISMPRFHKKNISLCKRLANKASFKIIMLGGIEDITEENKEKLIKKLGKSNLKEKTAYLSEYKPKYFAALCVNIKNEIKKNKNIKRNDIKSIIIFFMNKFAIKYGFSTICFIEESKNNNFSYLNIMNFVDLKIIRKFHEKYGKEEESKEFSYYIHNDIINSWLY